MPTSYSESIPTIVKIMQKVQPKTVLDIGIGRGKYGLLAEEYCEGVVVDGVEAWKDYLTDVHKAIYRNIYNEDVTKMDLSKLPKYDLVLMIDVIEHFEKDNAYRILDELQCKVLISTPIEDYRAHYENHFEDHVSHWHIDDFRMYEYEDFSTELSTIVLVDTAKRKKEKALATENEKLRAENEQLKHEVHLMKNSRGWRALEKIRKAKNKLS